MTAGPTCSCGACQLHRWYNQIRPATGPLLLTREKVRPVQPLLRCFREKTLPARHKPPILGHFSCAGRTFLRIRPPSGQAGRTCSRTQSHFRHKTLPAARLGGPTGTKLSRRALPVSPPGTKLSQHARLGGPTGTKLSQHAPKRRFRPTIRAQGELCTASATNTTSRAKIVTHQHPTAPQQRIPPPIPHAIRLRELSTKPRNVAIPTITIQISKHSQGNCLRN